VEAQEDFVRGQQAGLLRAAYLLTGDRGAAQDLAQEALVRVLLHWRKVERAELVAMPPRQRAAVVLRHYEDCSEAETDALMGCSVGNRFAFDGDPRAYVEYMQGGCPEPIPASDPCDPAPFRR
jgi:DNA-directed RNA polymerase specialized sigma24 family protein